MLHLVVSESELFRLKSLPDCFQIKIPDDLGYRRRKFLGTQKRCSLASLERV